jgi:lysophospholipase L1-like esterase
MKRILCYGDSNTWGQNPLTKERYDDQTRWTRVLASALGPEYEVVEEGLNGRTTVWEDPIEGYKNGASYLIPCLGTHQPLDLVIIMLGTNDLKKRFSLPAYDIAEGAGVLVRLVLASEAGRTGKPPEVLLLAPPPIAALSDYAEMFEEATPKSFKLGAHFQRIAKQFDIPFMDTSEVVVSSAIDGIHLDASEHAKLGHAVAGKVREILGE